MLRYSTIFSNAIASAVSSPINTGNARSVTIHAVVNTIGGTSTLSVEISNDGTNWMVYKKLISNLTNSNSQTLTRVASLSLGPDTTMSIASFSPEDAIYYARLRLTIGGGTYTVGIAIDDTDLVL